MKKLFTLITIMLTTLTAAQAGDWGTILVKGSGVRSDNMNDILGDGGSVSYNPTNNELTLRNANIVSDNKSCAILYCSGGKEILNQTFKIRLIGKNTIQHNNESVPLFLAPYDVSRTDSILIYSTDNGSLNITTSSKEGGISWTTQKLVVKDCTLNINCSNDDATVFNGDHEEKICFINANVTGECKYNAAFTYTHSIEYHGCYMTTPNDPWITPGDRFLSVHSNNNKIVIVKGKDDVSPALFNDTPWTKYTTPKSTKVYWDDAIDNLTDAKDLKYILFLKKKKDVYWEQVITPDLPHTTGSTSSYNITGLEPNTEYEFAIKVLDKAENPTMYKRIYFTTERNLPPTLPDNHNIAYASTKNSLILQWNPATDDATSIDELQYILEYKKKSASRWSQKQLGNTSTDTITDFEPNETYQIDLVVVDEFGSFSRYGEIEVVTPAAMSIDHITIDDAKHTTAHTLQGLKARDGYKGIVVKNKKKYLQK